MIASRLQAIKPSATLAMNAQAIAMQKEGIDVVKFGTGEPDFDTPVNIKNAAKAALDAGFTKYTATGGIVELKEAICAKLKRDNGITATTKEVIVTNGGKQALYNCFMALLNPGDEVILPSPYWVSYADMIALAEGTTRIVDTTSNHFKLTAAMVEAAVTPRTKALILNSPSNPTGALIEKEELLKIAQLALKHGFYLISDEVYEYFAYDGRHSFSVGSLPELAGKVFTINAVSKTYSMTGWRVGYCAGPAEFIKAMDDMQGHTTSNACSIAQKAALEAITGPQDSVRVMAEAFTRRRDLITARLQGIAGLKMLKPEGAFYAFPDVSALYTPAMPDSFAFAQALLKEAHVAVVPGGAFGAEGERFVRLSYATSEAQIEEGCARINRWVGSLYKTRHSV